MNQFVFSAFFVAAVLGGSLHNATGQMINPTVQTSSTRVAASRSAPATSAKPVVTTRVAPQAVVRPMGVPGIVGEEIICSFAEQLSRCSSQSLQLRGIYDV